MQLALLNKTENVFKYGGMTSFELLSFKYYTRLPNTFTKMDSFFTSVVLAFLSISTQGIFIKHSKIVNTQILIQNYKFILMVLTARTTIKNDKLSTMIVGGDFARLGQFPYQIQVEPTSEFGGASLARVYDT